MHPGFDIIGDVHGHGRQTLLPLLANLGYQQHKGVLPTPLSASDFRWRSHRQRPPNRGCSRKPVKAMVDAGSCARRHGKIMN